MCRKDTVTLYYTVLGCMKHTSSGLKYCPVLVNWNLLGVEGEKQRSRVQGWLLFYGTSCQWERPVPNTLATRTFGADKVALKQVINVFAGSSHWVIHPCQVNTQSQFTISSLHSTSNLCIQQMSASILRTCAVGSGDQGQKVLDPLGMLHP